MWIAILVRAFSSMHLSEISGELGLHVVTRGNVLVGDHHLPPGLEALLGRARDGELLVAGLVARLLGEDLTLQVRLDLPHRLSALTLGDGLQEALDRVQSAINVVGGEGLLVGPLVAHLEQLAHVRSLHVAQHVAKHALPVVHHPLEERLDVPVDGAVGVRPDRPGPPGDVLHPIGPQFRPQLALHEGHEPRLEHV